jgi:uncharacterized protein (TIRG00374 family)
VVGVLLSALLVWLTLRGEDPAQIWARIQLADLPLLGAAIVVVVLGYFFRAFRWRVLLAPVDPETRLGNRFRSTLIGFMANNLLPARVGEFARAYALSRVESRVSASAAFGSLVVERVLDGLVVGLFLVLPTLLPGFPTDGLGQEFTLIVRGAMTLLGVMLGGLTLLLLVPGPMVRLVEAAAQLLPAAARRLVVDAMEAFLTSLQVVRSPWLLLQAFAWSVAFWLWNGLSFYLGMLAFDVDPGFLGALFTQSVVGFAVALPAAPGFFGTFHIGAQFALETVYGAGAEATLAFAYAYHLGGFIPVTLLGLWYLRTLGISMSEVGASEEVVEEAVEGKAPA